MNEHINWSISILYSSSDQDTEDPTDPQCTGFWIQETEQIKQDGIRSTPIPRVTPGKFLSLTLPSSFWRITLIEWKSIKVILREVGLEKGPEGEERQQGTSSSTNLDFSFFFLWEFVSFKKKKVLQQDKKSAFHIVFQNESPLHSNPYPRWPTLTSCLFRFPKRKKWIHSKN